MPSNVISFFILFHLISLVSASGPLGRYIIDHDRLSYDTQHTHAAHRRYRRSPLQSEPLAVDFDALGRQFRVRLRRDTSVFAADVRLHDESGAELPLDTDHIYSGHLEGEPDSHVHGWMSDGVFQGTIETRHRNYYVEKIAYHRNESDSADSGRHHSIIYTDDHLRQPETDSGGGPFGGCGLNSAVEDSMLTLQSSAVHQQDHRRSQPPDTLPPSSAIHYKYTEEAQRSVLDVWTPDDDAYTVRAARVARSPRTGGATSHLPNSRGTCSVSIETDPLLWRHVYQHERDEQRTREEITALVASHMVAVNRIYRGVSFDGRYQHRGIKFEVQRMKIDNDSSCDPRYPGEQNQFCIQHVDVSNFLNMHSQKNHEAFCLSYVFTYRDFNRGTLGLAWVASSEGSSGGICETYKPYSTTMQDTPITRNRSLNTGIITLVNYGKRVPARVSQLTLAHEIGHNMGSPHDFPAHCTPGGSSGNYIMYSSATGGDLPNNSKFSACSLRNISAVLDAITASSGKRDCFTKSDGAFCGNKIVEEGEECDCGFDDTECEEKCCYPSQLSPRDVAFNSSAAGCTRRALTQCSPSEGPCCDRGTCMFVSSRVSRQCRDADECTFSATCDGRGAVCPSSQHRNNMTECNKGTKVCVDGVCKGSICLKHGMSECFLASADIEDRAKLCEVACQIGDNTSSCLSSSRLGMRDGRGIYMTAGSACDNFQGYCDVFLRCRRVDAEGPLASLKNLLFSEKTLMTIVDWVTVYWWAVLFMAIVFVILMALFIRCFAVHTPSSNPKRAPARRFTDTLKHPMGTLRRQRHHQQHQQQRGQHSASSAGGERQRLADLSAVATPTPPSRGPPPPYSQPVAPPTRHGFGQGRGHYSRQVTADCSTPQQQQRQQNRSNKSRTSKL